ncbi:RelA/SpoT family protein [Pygmaiobacter massiliensis]|uniref:RelA/SpoT family protein n=2 Tax=Pygmaiobacter massiliensis TaxID=1917873 RepID=UPI0028A0A19F|nr:bifunctional (p)ppGpp synthetase/guanosine-3',5'-bis(diphosphate) 3'-pyrophosphohydrolase [Pygmaiobacter massiliensis]
MILLEELITYDKLKTLIADSGRSYDLAVIDKAYALAEKAHRGVARKSGEPYITHPLNVAALLIDLGLDTESIAAALLHDVVEDTEVSLANLKSEFGEEITALVDGVTKLGKITFSTMEEQQAENLRKMLLAMSQDIRVMLIKLCDRLHNMRTMDAMPEQKRRDKALETMEVYAPIAHRLGMNNVQEELEDHSLQYLDPVGYGDITHMLSQNGGAHQFVQDLADLIRERLSENGIVDAQLSSRIKSVYGIYRKMFIQNKEFAEIYDVYALRIIVENVGECYNALGIIHDMFHPLPNRFKDYISTPKPNGYQSLHTTVLGHQGIPFEVQIRTWEMHHTAEYGVAAHWKYKEGIRGADKLEERLAWVRQLLESQRDSEDAVDLLRNIKSELLPEEVFVFTPRGDVINLPTGATVIDFAYAIHSAVGNRMTGAKVNGRIVPIDHKVVTGEIIEVLTGAKDKGPSRDWLSIVTTSEAKNKIRSWFKKERREENILEGKTALDREMRRNLVTLPEDKYVSFMEDIARRQRMNSAEEMYAAIGYGGLQVSRLMPKIKEEYTKLIKASDPVETFQLPMKKQKSSEGVIVEGLDNCLVKFAKCCNPLPGDAIVGFITRGFGVSIHKKDCPNVQIGMNLDDNSPRWVKAWWADGVKESFKSTLEITAMDRESLIVDVSSSLANMKVPIYSFVARQTADGRNNITVTVGISNIDHLGSVITKLKKIKDVVAVNRL